MVELSFDIHLKWVKAEGGMYSILGICKTETEEDGKPKKINVWSGVINTRRTINKEDTALLCACNFHGWKHCLTSADCCSLFLRKMQPKRPILKRKKHAATKAVFEN